MSQFIDLDELDEGNTSAVETPSTQAETAVADDGQQSEEAKTTEEVVTNTEKPREGDNTSEEVIAEAVEEQETDAKVMNFESQQKLLARFKKQGEENKVLKQTLVDKEAEINEFREKFMAVTGEKKPDIGDKKVSEMTPQELAEFVGRVSEDAITKKAIEEETQKSWKRFEEANPALSKDDRARNIIDYAARAVANQVFYQTGNRVAPDFAGVAGTITELLEAERNAARDSEGQRVTVVNSMKQPTSQADLVASETSEKDPIDQAYDLSALD